MDKMEPNDDILFADENTGGVYRNNGGAWKILIVDDEPDVHDVTTMALTDFRFMEKGLEFLHSYSGNDALRTIEATPDVALMLLDVVMETDDAGLEVARKTREELGNSNVRIVLRTGQPGQAPEKNVIVDYDINDYKEKTEITAQKLHTTLLSSLRSYRDIVSLENNKKGLERVIEATARISEPQAMEKFASGVLEQLGALLNIAPEALYAQSSPGGGLTAAGHAPDGIKIISGIGEFKDLSGRDARDVLDETVMGKLLRAVGAKRNLRAPEDYVAFFESKGGTTNIAYVKGDHDLDELENHLVEIFCRNVSIAFDNAYLREDIENTQREIVHRLSEAVETRSRETGNHVKRVAEYSRLLALGLGMTEEEAELVRLSAPLHDVGKVGIPDAILNKPGKLNAQEWKVMQSHSALGFQLLKGSNREIIHAGGHIAYEHHEKWDGTGYPNGHAGKNIHVYGRIVALADVFDALGSERCYKQAWDLDDIFAYLRRERGKQFDPELIDIFFDEQQRFLEIRDRFAD